jgi:hypothetical protein
MTKHVRRSLALWILGSTLFMNTIFSGGRPARSEPWPFVFLSLLGFAVCIYLFIRVWLVHAFMVPPPPGMSREKRKQRIQEAERKEAALWRSRWPDHEGK